MSKTNSCNRLLSMMLCICMMLTLLPGIPVAAVVDDLTVTIDTGAFITLTDSNGDDYYEIGTADELYALAALVNDGNTSINVVLTADIVVNEGIMREDSSDARVWTPIGNDSNKYRGTFNGGNHKIFGLYFNDSYSDDVGLFGYVNRGTVENVGVTNSWLTGSDDVGCVIGHNYYGIVTNCYHAGMVTGKGFNIGGVVGNNYYGSVTGCYNAGLVNSANYNTGGVVGYSYHGTIANSYNTGEIIAANEVGGVVGYNDMGTLNNCYNTGAVTGKYYGRVGGIAGYNSGMVSDCFNTGEIVGNYGSYTGGVVGYNSGTIKSCSNTGSITSDSDRVGGIAGYNNEATVNDCYNNGAICGEECVGGIVGSTSDGTITNCHNTGSVSGDSSVGGVAGYGSSAVSNCFNSGDVTGRSFVGGLVGENYDKEAIVKNCYNTGAISGNIYTGGVVGDSADGIITNCHNTGSVAGGDFVGGIVGANSGTVSNCYYISTGEINRDLGGIRGKDVAGQAEANTEEQFASGEVAYLLGAAWGQQLGVDDIPVLFGEKVYFENDTYFNIRYAITQKGRNLSYTDMIYVIDVFDLTGVEGIDLSKDAGLLIWSVEEFEALSEIAFDEAHANPGLYPYQDTAFYYGASDGIFTRDLHEEAYYVGYVKLADGSYVYSEPKLYSPAAYAYNMLGKDTTSAETKELCVALLNYISAAQVYFHGTAEEDLVNYDLTDEQKALNWENISFNLAPDVSADKRVERDTDVFTGTGKNLQFEEMISIVSVFKIEDDIVSNAQESGTIYWTAEQFAALEGAPSIDNMGAGTKVERSQYRNTAGQWCSYAPAVAAKELADTQYYYLGYVVHADGTVSYSSVISYTAEQYIYNKVNDTDTSDAMLAFAKWLYRYERAAKLAIG